uniref:Uncharacterized protein n=1 Tax=Manihot esculenta TaxID=3983 RepID=A0A2C9UMB3_MANES
MRLWSFIFLPCMDNCPDSIWMGNDPLYHLKYRLSKAKDQAGSFSSVSH